MWAGCKHWFFNLLLPSVWVCLLCHVKLQTAWNQTSCLVSVILNREGSMRSFCLILAGTVVLAKCIPQGGLGCQCAVTYRVTLPHPGFHTGGNTVCHVKGTRWWGQDASTEQDHDESKKEGRRKQTQCPGTTLEPRPSLAYQERLTKEVPRIRYPNYLDWLRAAWRSSSSTLSPSWMTKLFALFLRLSPDTLAKEPNLCS